MTTERRARQLQTTHTCATASHPVGSTFRLMRVSARRHMLVDMQVLNEESGSIAAKSDVRGSRYGEVFAVARRGFQLESRVYNTFGLNDCPTARWNALDTEALTKELGVDGVVLNGPRWWLMDAIETPHVKQEIVTLGGLQMRLVASMRIPLSRLAKGRSPYTESTIQRTTSWLFRGGAPVFELTAADGRIYVMQSYSTAIDADLSQEQLPTLGGRLGLPAGWRYAMRILDEDLHLRVDGEAIILQDDLQNTYQVRP